jgi:hypothetical protein
MAARGKTIMVDYGRITPTQKIYAMKQQPFQFRMRNSAKGLTELRISVVQQIAAAFEPHRPSRRTQ